MKEEEVGTAFEKHCETNPVHEEVTQLFGKGWIRNDFLQSLQGQGTLTETPRAADSLAFRKLLFALISRNMASGSGGEKFERDQADATF